MKEKQQTSGITIDKNLSFDDQVYLARAAQYFEHATGNILQALALAFIFFLPILYYANVATDILIVWTVACVASALITVWVERQIAETAITIETARGWVAKRMWSGNSLGALYGITPFLLPQVAEVSTVGIEFLLYMLLSGVMVSASFSYLVVPVHAYVNSAVILGPITLYFFLKGDAEAVLLGVFSIIWQFIVLSKVVRAAKATIETIELQHQLKEANVKLQGLNAEVEQAANAKSKFLAAASHDLRQPLQAIRLFNAAIANQITKGEKLDQNSAQRMSGRIDQSVEALRGLLNSVLDISKLDSGSMEKNEAAFPVQNLLEESKTTFGPLAEEKGLTFKVVPSSAVILSDQVQLKRILDNLISNAIRYTPSGRVLVGCRRKGRDLRMEVWDTGEGISPEEMDHIFDEFYQAANPARQREKGFGLGLAIVRRTADLLGHDFDAVSSPGEGSVFSVTVPLTSTNNLPAPVPQSEAGSLANFAGKKVVFVEDDALVREATLNLLGGWELEITAAETARGGEKRLAALKEKGESPDLFIVDFQLPGERSGLDFYLAHCRDFGEKIPGILISGTTDPKSLGDFKESGMTFLSKPIVPEDLKKEIQRLLG